MFYKMSNYSFNVMTDFSGCNPRRFLNIMSQFLSFSVSFRLLLLSLSLTPAPSPWKVFWDNLLEVFAPRVNQAALIALFKLW